jgi:threonine dehydratase
VAFSFKERGARNTLELLAEEKDKRGVIAASAGNHALALAHHGHELSIPVVVLMPEIAPLMKVERCRQYGAEIIVHGRDIGEAKEKALQMAKERDLVYVNGYDDPRILAGQGTAALEVVSQMEQLGKECDAVVIPVGGGGLLAGMAVALKHYIPHVEVIGVESEQCASFSAAMKAGRPVYTKALPTLADGLAVPEVGTNAFYCAQPCVDRVVVVSEKDIALAILRLVEVEKSVVEGAGATGLAACLSGQLDHLQGKNVVVMLCGGNIDTTTLGRCLERGLAADGRMATFKVVLEDRPGSIAGLTRLLSELKCSVKDITHERTWLQASIHHVEIECVVETVSKEHRRSLKTALLDKYEGGLVEWGAQKLDHTSQ